MCVKSDEVPSKLKRRHQDERRRGISQRGVFIPNLGNVAALQTTRKHIKVRHGN